MSKTQSVTLSKGYAIPSGGLQELYFYDDVIQLSHKAVEVKKVILSVYPTGKGSTIVSASGELGVTGKKPFVCSIDLVNQNFNRLIFDDKKPHEVNLYIGEGAASYLNVTIVANNPTALDTYMFVGLYIEFEVL